MRHANLAVLFGLLTFTSWALADSIDPYDPYMPDTVWSNSGEGNFLDGANWSAGVVPGASSSAAIQNGGTSDLAGSATVTNLFLNGTTPGVDTLNVATGGSLVVTGLLSTSWPSFLVPPDEVFYSGFGALNISGRVTAAAFSALNFDSVPAPVSAVTIKDGGLLFVGDASTKASFRVNNGTLNVQGVGADGTASTLKIVGDHSYSDFMSDTKVGIGGSSLGPAPVMVTLSDGGQGVSDLHRMTFGIGGTIVTNSQTVLNVEGVNAATGVASQWTDTSDFLTIGYTGDAVVNVTDGGRISAHATQMGMYDRGFLDVSKINRIGSPSNRGWAQVTISGVNANGSASTWEAGSLTVGANLSGAELHIADGGLLHATTASFSDRTGFSDASSNPRTRSTVTVSGLDSASGLRARLSVDGATLLDGNSSSVLVDDGGLVSTGDFTMRSNARATVQGVGTGGVASAWQINGALIMNGAGGVFTVSDGGALTTASAGIGALSGTSASVVVTGMGGTQPSPGRMPVRWSWARAAQAP